MMGAAGADWLTREDREKFEQPEDVLDALNIWPGMTVADVGAGNGYFTLRLARRVKDERAGVRRRYSASHAGPAGESTRNGRG